VLLGAVACTSDSSTPAGGSGGQGSGGLTSSGGSGSGGAAGAGGTTSQASGGKTGTGGSGAGGAPATGGTTTVASGGVASTGGSTGKGGTTGASGGTTGGGEDGGSTSPRDGGPGAGGRDGGFGGRPTDGGTTGSGSGGQSGGNTGTTATGGTSGSGPCKASPCVIFPLGDSITHGFNSTDDAGYRSGLFKSAVAAGQNITFIGSLSNGPSTISNKPFPKNHEGHDGNTITQMMGYIPPKKAFSTTPHIVLLHIGTNDITNKSDPSTMASQLDTLLTSLVDAAPNALVVVAKIVPLGYNDTNYTSYNAKIPDIVKAHAAKNQNVVMVDMSTLPSSDIRGSGNVHPTDKGYSDMGDLWYGAIKSYLPN
jgi:lysophospholipase L1-like esterase